MTDNANDPIDVNEENRDSNELQTTDQNKLLSEADNSDKLQVKFANDTKIEINSQMLNVVADPVSISWHNINVSRKQKSNECCSFIRKQKLPYVPIIKDVSGHVNSGQILALMGASGAGKTTLLNVLTGRNLSSLLVKGVVRLNGKVSDINTITSISAYVQQDDLFIGTLTVREHLIFQSLLRMDQSISKTKRVARINQVISELGLKKCAESRIGTSGGAKSISGGERKRLAFASEVLTNPSLMFCDEPTSGLDSFMAQSVVTVLNQMAKQGRTIICTIHQPSSEVFEMFNRLLLIADGRVAFMGSSDEALNFFADNSLKCPPNYNPADFYIHELAVIPGKEDECKKKINNICDAYAISHYAKQSMAETVKHSEGEMGSRDNILVSFGFKSSARYKANCFKQFCALLWRSILTCVREPMITRVRIMQTITIAVILGAIYWRQSYDQKGVMNINGALFLLITNMTFQNAFAVINSFSVEIQIFLREHNNGMYRVDAYFIAKMLAELPIFLLIPTIFTCIYYPMVGLHNTIEAFSFCLLIAILVANTACSFGYLMSCLCGSVTLALSLTPPIMVPLFIFGGFFLNNSTVPVYFLWLKYISWFFYGNEALMINQWRDVHHIDCSNSSLTDDNNANVTATPVEERCLRNGRMVLDSYDFDESRFLIDIILLIVLLLLLRVFAYFALFVRSRKR